MAFRLLYSYTLSFFISRINGNTFGLNKSQTSLSKWQSITPTVYCLFTVSAVAWNSLWNSREPGPRLTKARRVPFYFFSGFLNSSICLSRRGRIESSVTASSDAQPYWMVSKIEINLIIKLQSRAPLIKPSSRESLNYNTNHRRESFTCDTISSGICSNRFLSIE